LCTSLHYQTASKRQYRQLGAALLSARACALCLIRADGTGASSDITAFHLSRSGRLLCALATPDGRMNHRPKSSLQAPLPSPFLGKSTTRTGELLSRFALSPEPGIKTSRYGCASRCTPVPRCSPGPLAFAVPLVHPVQAAYLKTRPVPLPCDALSCFLASDVSCCCRLDIANFVVAVLLNVDVSISIGSDVLWYSA
jgi:hypothetical protein